jgi:hypothetical protein
MKQSVKRRHESVIILIREVLKPEFYVYSLTDPRDMSIFYIGKGCGDRVHDHVRNVLAGRVDNPSKCLRIIELHKAGFEVVETILAQGMFEEDALALEKEMIKGHSNLTNSKRQMDFCARSKKRAQCLLARLKTFEQWITTAPKQAEESVKCGYGATPREFYDRFRSEIENLAAHGQQEWVTVYQREVA